MSIAAEGGSASPTVPDAAARVLEFTQVARVRDVPLILNALSVVELTAGIARDDPARWPLENAVRQHLDNDPHRWRTMVRRLMEAGPLEYAQLVDLVEAVGGGAGAAAEGEA